MVATSLALQAGPPAPRAVASRQATPEVIFSGLPTADGVRYGLVFIPSEDMAFSNLRVEVSLPPDATVLEVKQAADRAVFVGEGKMLEWAAPGYEAGAPIDPFAFVLAAPLSASANIRASWENDAGGGALSLTAQPDLLPAATALSGVLTVTAESAQSYVPVENSGVRVTYPRAIAPEGATLDAARALPDADPPAGVGSPWWCAVVDLGGSPDGFEPYVLVPARQALPPNVPVTLFALRNGEWQELGPGGMTSPDGQYVGFLHPGGTVAAGLPPQFQPGTIRLILPTPTPTPTLALPLIRITPGLPGQLSPPTATPSPTVTRTPFPTSTPVTPQPTAFVRVTDISGSTVVRSGMSDLHWTVTVTNSGSAPSLPSLYVDIRGPGSPVDWNTIQIDGATRGFSCRIVQGAAILGSTRAECSDGLLGPGESAKLTVKGSTTVVIGGGERTFEAYLYRSPADVASGAYINGFISQYTVNP